MAKPYDINDIKKKLFWRTFELVYLTQKRLIPFSNRIRVVDYGCGNAIQTILLSSIAKEVIALDFDKPNYESYSQGLDVAKKNLNK